MHVCVCAHVHVVLGEYMYVDMYVHLVRFSIEQENSRNTLQHGPESMFMRVGACT